MTNKEVNFWFDTVGDIITTFRKHRADAGVPPQQIIDGQLTVQTWQQADYLYRSIEIIERLGKVRLCGILVRDPVPTSVSIEDTQS